MFLFIYVWSRKVDCILYLICSISTWTREIWLDSDWVDLFDNKFGDHAGDMHRSDFILFWFHICLSILFLASRNLPPLYFVFEECLASSWCSLDHYQTFFPSSIGNMDFNLFVSPPTHLGCVERAPLVSFFNVEVLVV